MGQLNGKVAVVTGASKGIGAAIAKGFAAEGAAVVVNYASSREGADRVVEAIRSEGGQAVAVQGDVASREDIRRLFAEAKSAFGKVDVLVNNAGVFKFEPLEAISESEFHRQFNTNVLGTILATQEAVQHFGPQGGSIVNVSSMVSTNPPAASTVYGATKAAVNSVTLSLARELGPRGIRVNAINPGLTETEGALQMDFFGTEAEQALVASTPLGRRAQPGDIVPAAVFLASDQSAWITGETLRVSGGLN